MPKKKKTRKQKMVADMRHKEYSQEPLEHIQLANNVHEDSKSSNEQKDAYNAKPVQVARVHHSSLETQVIATADYRYLYIDLLKTVMLTISVIVVELVLHYFVFGA